jgi:hypothetical protein
MMRFVIWMLRLYPRAWRERYGSEMIALLELHSITFWTVVDLLSGALDARLDPYYRREHPLLPRLPWRGLQSSWHIMFTAFMTFWLTLILWLSGGGPWGPLSFNWPSADVTQALGSLAFLSLPALLTALVGWIGWQGAKNAWQLLRLLPMIIFVQLLLLPPWLDGWQNALLWLIFLLALAFTASSFGAMLTSFTRWERRVNLPLSIGMRVLALVVITGMASLCLINETWISGFWSSYWNMTISPYWWYGPVTLTLELATMFLATLLAFFALVRSFFELKALYKNQATPGDPERERGTNVSRYRELTRAPAATPPPLASRYQPASVLTTRLPPVLWLLIAPFLLAIFTISLVVVANFTYTFTTTTPDAFVSVLSLSSAFASLCITLIVTIGVRKNGKRPGQMLAWQRVPVVHERL